MEVLYIVATPIGNLEDIGLRAARTLLTTPVIAAEDTRRTGNLINLLSDQYPQYSCLRKFISVRDWNESAVVQRVIEALLIGDVALVSDAGTPLISDPGFKVVRAARTAGFKVSPIPGPSAAIAALSVSGLPTDKFVFMGFLRKNTNLYPGMTNVIYESPNRTQATITRLHDKYPTAQIVVAQELTKIHEDISEYHPAMKFKGEITLLAYIPQDASPRH